MKQKTSGSRLLHFLPYIILTVFFVAAPILFKSRTWLNSFIMIFVSVVGAVSLRTISLSGNMSFAHGAFIGVGAYMSAYLAKSLAVPIFVSIPLAAVFAMLLGVLTGWPFARLRSIYFCMGSMFMGVAIVQFISSITAVGGALGMTKIPSLGGALKDVFAGEFWKNILDALGLGTVQMSYYFFLIITLLCLAILYRFEHSRIGWTLRALSQSPEVAASIGVNERFYRLLSVGLGCFCAGLIGAVYAHYNTALNPNSYSMGTTLWLIMYMMIGGSNNFLGPIVGAILLELVKQATTLLTAISGSANVSEGFVAFTRWTGTYSAYSPFLTAAVLLLMAYFIPGGLVSIPGKIREARLRHKENAAQASGKGGEDSAA